MPYSRASTGIVPHVSPDSVDQGGLNFASIEDAVYAGSVYTWCYLMCNVELAAVKGVFTEMARRHRASLLLYVKRIFEKFEIEDKIWPVDPIGVQIKINAEEELTLVNTLKQQE